MTRERIFSQLICFQEGSEFNDIVRAYRWKKHERLRLLESTIKDAVQPVSHPVNRCDLASALHSSGAHFAMRAVTSLQHKTVGWKFRLRAADSSVPQMGQATPQKPKNPDIPERSGQSMLPSLRMATSHCLVQHGNWTNDSQIVRKWDS